MNKLIPFFMAVLIVLSDGVHNLAHCVTFYDLHTDWLDFNCQSVWHKSFVQKATHTANHFERLCTDLKNGVKLFVAFCFTYPEK